MAGISNCSTIWILSDGAPGHLSQSRGIAEAIGRFCTVDTIEVNLKVRVSLLKSSMRYLLPISTKFSRWLLYLVYKIDLPEGNPDLIVSSGGNTLLASALLRQCLDVPNVYSGTLKNYPACCYARIFSVTSLGCDNNVILPLPPVPLNLTEPMPAAAADAPWLILVGGDGAGYRYTSDDWSLLVDGVNQISHDSGLRWLLTTSRRTGTEAETLLQEGLDSEHVDEAVYYGQTPRPVVREFLERCQGVLVTEDSLTMVAEAIYSGRPVVTLRPKQSLPEGNDAVALDGYVKKKMITRIEIANLRNLNQLPDISSVNVCDVPKLIWESVLDLLDGEGRVNVRT